MFLTIIIFIITILFIVLIHELGHFLMAKKFNIKVEEFGFGIPPRAWGKKIGETLVSINWLPFGGFVRLLGEDEAAPPNLNHKGKEINRYFSMKPVGQRIVVVIAGVVMNFLLSFLIFYLVIGLQGFKIQFPLYFNHQFIGVDQKNETKIIVSMVNPGSPAEVAGIKSGEQIISINNELVNENTQAISKIKNFSGREEEIILRTSQGSFKSVRVTPRLNPPVGEGPLGVALNQIQIANVSFSSTWQKVLAGPIHSLNIVIYSGEILGRLINQSFTEKSFGPVSTSVSGPVGITNLANSILQTASPILPYLDFIGLISLNLAVFNLLPIPALDGGRLFFLVIEAIFKKRVHAGIERWIHTIGFAILMSLTLLVTLSDIKKIF